MPSFIFGAPVCRRRAVLCRQIAIGVLFYNFQPGFDAEWKCNAKNNHSSGPDIGSVIGPMRVSMHKQTQQE
jgi:hypothetical protein